MTEFQTVARVGEIPEGEGRSFAVDGRLIAVFLTDGEYTAISDFCPHMGASLASGWVDKGAVTCPWHAWRFCVKDGSWLDAPNSKIRVNTYSVRLEGDSIQVSKLPNDRAEATPSQ